MGWLSEGWSRAGFFVTGQVGRCGWAGVGKHPSASAPESAVPRGSLGGCGLEGLVETGSARFRASRKGCARAGADSCGS
eukprot:13145872-Alexandrium_andersonii.AAC.1